MPLIKPHKPENKMIVITIKSKEFDSISVIKITFIYLNSALVSLIV